MINNLLKRGGKQPNLVSTMRGANLFNASAVSQRSLHTPLGSSSSKEESYQVCIAIINISGKLRNEAKSRVG